MITNRIAQGLRKQDWFTAILELIILIVGIYIGLQVDDWASDRKDRQTEIMYLELLARDTAELQLEVAAQHTFESAGVDVAARAYELLRSDNPSAHQAKLRELLTALQSRRTVNLVSATYEQMVSSDHLQLIRDPGLRDKLSRYFAMMRRGEAVLRKNNQDLVDGIYGPFLLHSGISLSFELHDTESPLHRSAAQRLWRSVSARITNHNPTLFCRGRTRPNPGVIFAAM